jgi:mannose-6-phosphate isomerase-like protein (cupin superfamily)
MNHTMPDEPMRWIQAASEGKKFEIAGALVTLKITSKESGACAVVEATLPPYFSGSRPHVHRQTTEVFYVLNGSLAFTVGEETVIARQGSIIHVAPGVVHRFWNPTAAPSTYLAFLSPGGFEQYWVELSTLLADEPSWPPADLNQIETLGMKYDQFPA